MIVPMKKVFLFMRGEKKQEALEKLQNLSERNIYIPFDYENPTDVTNQNLEYRTLSL